MIDGDSDRLLLERVAADACPPLEQVEVEGWRLRAAAGVTKRANSALPLSDALPVAQVEAFYRERGLPPRVQVSERRVDEALAARGWERDFEVTVLTGPVPAGPSSALVEPAVDEAWTDCWWAVDGRGGDAERAVAVEVLQRIQAPAAYASVRLEGQVVAVGRGVAQEGLLGVFAMAVLPEHRRRGLGREVLQALGSWGASQGAERVYLQVLDDNVAARSLYAAAGLAPAHGYHYRTLT
jgi:GNAT superfamily N-acetyltransferase